MVIFSNIGLNFDILLFLKEFENIEKLFLTLASNCRKLLKPRILLEEKLMWK